MRKTLTLLAALTLALTGCDTLTKPNLAGTYHYVGKRVPFQMLNKFELTDRKFIADIFLGETALDYEVEDGFIYVNSAGVKYRLKIVSPDTLRADAHSPFEGTYARVK